MLENAFALPLSRASQIRSQQQRQRGWKLYSFHAPEVECIGKGKAPAPYEFGAKASIITNNRRAPGGLFVLHARALPDKPDDGHTLRDVIDRTEALTGCPIERAYVDKGYRGHDAQNPRRVFISGQKRGVFGAIKRELRRRSAIEPIIGHLKADGRLPLLPQRPRRRCRQRHPLSGRPQLPPHPRLAEGSLAPVPDHPHRRRQRPLTTQIGFLTDD